jgi:hypothetical protein
MQLFYPKQTLQNKPETPDAPRLPENPGTRYDIKSLFRTIVVSAAL